MIRALYKSILKKLNLSREQLVDLKARLDSSSVCHGPFLKDGKMCPNTTALAVKLGKSDFENDCMVKDLLRKNGVDGFNLWMFYLLVDVPATFSNTHFERSLQSMREVIDELST